jgi:hypothetical protein
MRSRRGIGRARFDRGGAGGGGDDVIEIGLGELGNPHREALMLAAPAELVHGQGLDAVEGETELAGQFERFFQRFPMDRAGCDLERRPASNAKGLDDDTPPRHAFGDCDCP